MYTGNRSGVIIVLKISLKLTAVRLFISPLVGSSRSSLLTSIFSSSSVHHLLVPSLRLKAVAGSVIEGDIKNQAATPTRTDISPSSRNLWYH